MNRRHTTGKSRRTSQALPATDRGNRTRATFSDIQSARANVARTGLAFDAIQLRSTESQYAPVRVVLAPELVRFCSEIDERRKRDGVDQHDAIEARISD